MKPFAFIFSTPTLIPSIIFSIIFLFTSCLHLYRIIQTRRRVYILLFIFSLLRTILFIIRVAWSLNIDSNKLAITSGIFISGSFFIIILAIYTLLKDWILTLPLTKISNSNIRKYEKFTINIVEFLLPAFSILFIIGSIEEIDISIPPKEQGDFLIKFSMLCFLASVASYMFIITYFALKYGNKPIHLQLKPFVLYIIGALLLIEIVYGICMIFAQSSKKIEKYSWVFYFFETLPEVLILAILGGVILGEWFFKEENSDSIYSIESGKI